MSSHKRHPLYQVVDVLEAATSTRATAAVDLFSQAIEDIVSPMAYFLSVPLSDEVSNDVSVLISCNVFFT